MLRIKYFVTTPKIPIRKVVSKSILKFDNIVMLCYLFKVLSQIGNLTIPYYIWPLFLKMLVVIV